MSFHIIVNCVWKGWDLRERIYVVSYHFWRLVLWCLYSLSALCSERLRSKNGDNNHTKLFPQFLSSALLQNPDTSLSLLSSNPQPDTPKTTMSERFFLAPKARQTQTESGWCESDQSTSLFLGSERAHGASVQCPHHWLE